jgi:uncharacterized integral membrane protein (TIGR00698 family)
MKRPRYLFVSGWGRYVPGFLFCLVFAFAGMNLERVIGNYHKANLASLGIPGLEQELQEMLESGNNAESIAASRRAIEIHRSALDKVEGTAGQRWSWATFLYEKAQFTYVAILLLGGILIRNTVPIPQMLIPGISIARPIIKPGIILLGVHYVWADIVKVGGVGLGLTVVFIFGTAVVVMWLCKKWGVPDGLGGIMGAGTGVCGVSAIIATSPVVRSSPIEMAYAIGTILFFGTLMLFTMPYIGSSIDMSESEFGAWAAVAILNTAQLVAAAEWYGTEARDTAVLINVARIMFLPLVVLFSLWFYVLRTGKQEPGHEINKWQLVKDKFPVFILGFFLLVLLNSLNLASLGGPKITGSTFWAMNAVYKWFFAIGFAGIGLSISIEDMKKAGGKAFTIGMVAALVKMVLGLGVVLLIGSEWLQVTGS